MLLDVPTMTRPILNNYNTHADRLVQFLKKLDCCLVYDGPSDPFELFRDRITYACSIKMKRKKVLKHLFPIMIGSKLDLRIRHSGDIEFSTIPDSEPNLPFRELDIGIGFFVINGALRQLPYLFTNDSTNLHVTKNRSVRLYTYDKSDKGKQLCYYTDDERGQRSLQVTHNDGSVTRFDMHSFFDFCPYPANMEPYMSLVFKENQFDIDHLANKIVVSPGHLFVRLIVKYLYGPLRENDWSAIRSKANLVAKSISSGCLLHVLSRKTVYFKENSSSGKMVSMPSTSHREIGKNGKVFLEKSIGCYREVNLQTYPLNPYLSSLIVRQISNKVKSLSAFHPSYVGYLCILGCFETKNVGRTSMLVRNAYVSDESDLDPVFDETSRVWDALQIESRSGNQWKDVHYVVVNEACVSVTRKCFKRIDLCRLKHQFGRIECYQSANFIHIRYKVGLVFKILTDDVWVTSRDEMYWVGRLMGISSKSKLIDQLGFDYLTSYLTDLNPYCKHNFFSKNILGFNALKNAVLATDSKHARYCLESVSAYTKRTPRHKAVLEPADDTVSPHFVMYVPQVNVAYYCYKGLNQEDCIVMRDGVDVFDCFRIYTVRFKIENSKGFTFYPAKGEANRKFLGTLVECRPKSQCPSVEPQSMHVRVEKLSNTIFQLYFSKVPFKVLQYAQTKDSLIVCVEQPHVSASGDKLCSFHGQKGVIRIEHDPFPLLDESVTPDLIVNPYSLYRATPGQILEGLQMGGGKDAETVRHFNTDGKKSWIVPAGSTFYAKTLYFPIAYFSSEHFYAPTQCVQDKILGQAVRGRSRGGGMKIGNMEMLNGLRGNGIGACFEEKFLEQGDRFQTQVPKSVDLVLEDAKFYKCLIDYKVEELMEMNGEVKECV